MKLDELKKMIKEELDAFVQNENVDEINVDEVDVDVDAGDVDAEMGDEENNSEDILRQIYDMLKNKFDAEEETDKDDEDNVDEDMDEDMMDEVKHDDKKTEAADVEEAAAQGFGDAGNKKTSGANVGYTPAKTTRGDGKLHEDKSQLQERFQKLANIIK